MNMIQKHSFLSNFNRTLDRAPKQNIYLFIKFRYKSFNAIFGYFIAMLPIIVIK